METNPRPRLLWGLSASVAAIRADRLAAALLPHFELRAVITPKTRHFLPPLPNEVELFEDHLEWEQWRLLGDPVLHIELRRWADGLLVAPLSADLLAKWSQGICDNLLLSVLRAWDFTRPTFAAPAMNTLMWEHPVTDEHLGRLRRWGVQIIDPIAKTLACQDVGIGAMQEVDVITECVRRGWTTLS